MSIKVDSFIQCEKNIFSAWGFVSSVTGEVLSLSPIDKIIYLVMRDRFHFFKNVLKSEYYESQEETAKKCGTFRRKVNETISMFMENGAIVGEKRVRNRKLSWVYKNILPLKLCSENPNVKTKEKPHEAAIDFLNDDLGW